MIMLHFPAKLGHHYFAKCTRSGKKLLKSDTRLRRCVSAQLPTKGIRQPHDVFVVNNCLHEMNKIYEGCESSSQICISKLRLGLNISVKRRSIQTET